MGWLYMTNLKGHKTPKAYLEDQFTFAGEHVNLRVLRFGLVQMKRFYAAVERADETGNAITRAGCWAHMKRKIIDAEKPAPEIAREAVERVRALYAVERQGKDGSINRPSGAQNGNVQEQ